MALPKNEWLPPSVSHEQI
jgi:hypothetical protein